MRKIKKSNHKTKTSFEREKDKEVGWGGRIKKK